MGDLNFFFFFFTYTLVFTSSTLLIILNVADCTVFRAFYRRNVLSKVTVQLVHSLMFCKSMVNFINHKASPYITAMSPNLSFNSFYVVIINQDAAKHADNVWRKHLTIATLCTGIQPQTCYIVLCALVLWLFYLFFLLLLTHSNFLLNFESPNLHIVKNSRVFCF